MDYSKKSTNALKKLAKTREISSGGDRDDLIRRLVDHDAGLPVKFRRGVKRERPVTSLEFDHQPAHYGDQTQALFGIPRDVIKLCCFFLDYQSLVAMARTCKMIRVCVYGVMSQRLQFLFKKHLGSDPGLPLSLLTPKVYAYYEIEMVKQEQIRQLKPNPSRVGTTGFRVVTDIVFKLKRFGSLEHWRQTVTASKEEERRTAIRKVQLREERELSLDDKARELGYIFPNDLHIYSAIRKVGGWVGGEYYNSLAYKLLKHFWHNQPMISDDEFRYCLDTMVVRHPDVSKRPPKKIKILPIIPDTIPSPYHPDILKCTACLMCMSCPYH